MLSHEQCGIQQLRLRNNRIGDVGASALAAVLRANGSVVRRALQRLDISDNLIAVDGVRELADGLASNNTLVRLYLWPI